MNERRYFLKVLGSGAAAALGAACSAEPHGNGVGAGGDGAGGDGAGGSGAGGAPGAGGSTTTTGTHTTASSSGTTTTTSSGTTGNCETSPTGTKIGLLTAYASMGLHKVSSDSVLLGHDAGGYYALTSICTHQGCDMSGGDGQIESPNIVCFCHGSEFGPTGAVVQGPAHTALRAYALALGCDGFLYVNKSKTVAATVRLMA